MNKLLLLEDDRSLIDGLCYSLGKSGFSVKAVRTVKEAKAALTEQDAYDLLLLDVTLPDGSGFEVCEWVRKKGNMVPIIFLTAADEETSIIRGLDCGGDDYITKPFRLSELCSRIRALLRRSGMAKKETEEQLCSGSLRIDLIGHRAYLEGRPLELTGSEYRLLCLFLRNADKVLTRSMILDILWDGNGNFVDDNTLSVYIRRLREKIEEEPSNPKRLLTVRGLGYQWKE
ncbi:MAG: response regulator transcription factor [Eubacteriales bacterium]|nr:response regulator transcription factor [Eubacteriales bacterium]